ncbi:MAG: hypothetical protein NC401_16815, partial [Ruminococcus sp.]|nr:hypothetical protein [Ruminococcus sp.]
LVDYSVVFSIKLDTSLFIGNMVYNRHLEKALPAPAPPANNSKPPGTVYALGAKAANSVTMQTQEKPPSSTISFEKEGLSLGGAKADSSVTARLQAKPPSSGITVGNDNLFAAGAKVSGSKLSEIERKPVPTSISAKGSANIAVVLFEQSKDSAIGGVPTVSKITAPIINDYSHAAILVTTIKQSSIKTKNQ